MEKVIKIDNEKYYVLDTRAYRDRKCYQLRQMGRTPFWTIDGRNTFETLSDLKSWIDKSWIDG